MAAERKEVTMVDKRIVGVMFGAMLEIEEVDQALFERFKAEGKPRTMAAVRAERRQLQVLGLISGAWEEITEQLRDLQYAVSDDDDDSEPAADA